MIAMVLAAGLGTRLRPLTHTLAKPALPILGTTLLEENLGLLARAGIDEVVVNAHHLPETVAAVAHRAAETLGLKLHLSIESPEALGTGGALVAARPLLDRGGDFLLVNGDVLTDLDPAAAVAAHRALGAASTMILRPMPEGSDFAAVEVDEEGLVARIATHGRAIRQGERLASHLFTGIHVLSPAIFEVLPAKGVSCVNRQGQSLLIASGHPVLAHVEAGDRWSDVGTHDRYLEANLDRLLGRYDLPSATGDAVEVSASVWIAPSAEVAAGAELVGPCFVGAGARIEAGARVGPEAVILRGARVAGEVHGAVVAPGASVAQGQRISGSLHC